MICVSVIIVNYNTAQFVDACISSIRSFTHDVEYEIILIDNHSAERDIDHLYSKYPNLVKIQLTENIGFGRACNLGVQQAKGAFLLFLNPDTLLIDNSIKVMYDFWVAHHISLPIGCLGTILQDEKGKLIHSSGNFPSISVTVRQKLNSLCSRIIAARHGAESSQIIEEKDFTKVDYITGANLFMSKETFLLAGGFDPRFFMYFEETDLQLRLNRIGKHSFLLNKVHIIHFQSISTRNNRALLRVLYLNSLLQYFKKHSPPFKYYLFKTLWLLLDLPTFLQKLLLHKQIKR